jgi:DNA-binding CsgD family transcriptional regulator
MTFDDHSRYQDTICQIYAAESLVDLRHLMDDIRISYGLANIVYHAVYLPTADVANPILIFTYDPAWVARYQNQDYFKIDPVVAAGTRGFLPLDWSLLDHETKAARSFFKEADRFGVGRQGITFPVRAAGGERALFTVTSNASNREWEAQRFEYLREFQFIAYYFHDRAVTLAGYRSSSEVINLSARETQCLTLVAQGMCTKQVASQLDITDRTVRIYLQSACTKLGCASIHQAVAKLVMLEVIHPAFQS